MKRFSVLFLALCGLIFVVKKEAAAQEIQSSVMVNTDMVDPNLRYHVASMQSDLETYLNTTRFTDGDWEGPRIPVDIQIVLTGGYNNRFGARLFVASKRYIDGTGEGTSVALRLVDNQWGFEYSRGASFTYNQHRYDPISTLLDFYMLLIIGYDLDTYEELGGSSAYNIAKNLCQLGARSNAPGFDTYSTPGQFTRFSLVSEFTDPKYNLFRKILFSYYVDGLDQMAFNKPLAMKNLAAAVEDLAYFKKDVLAGPSVAMQAFFDAKAEELALLFVGYEDPGVYSNLIYLDPTNTMLYQEYRDK